MAVWGFGVAAVLAIVAALLPVLKGERLNVSFLGVGVVFLVLAVAAAKRAHASDTPPPAA